MTPTIENARLLWDYLASFRSVAPSDAIVVCCSYDLRVCDHACTLLEAGFAPLVVLSGRTGNWTSHLWDRPEAHVFFDRAVRNGVSEDQLLIEDGATNFGENVTLSRDLLQTAKTVTFLTKPASVLRVKLTVDAQWPEITGFVSCPDIEFPDEVSNAVGILGVISEMVGDVERIQKYPDLGYQAPHELPNEVVEAWEYLIEQGFTHHLIAPPRVSPA